MNKTDKTKYLIFQWIPDTNVKFLMAEKCYQGI